MTKLIHTIEVCPVCQNPEMDVAHGAKNHLGNRIHIEDCPECGKLYPIVCYDCQYCDVAQQTFAHDLLPCPIVIPQVCELNIMLHPQK